MSSILRSSKFVRYFFGLARSIVISNRQQIDGNLLQKSCHLNGLFSNNLSSSLSSFQSGSQLEQKVRQLDEDARRTGRVSLTEVEEALNNIKYSRRATASQSLLVIRCCGNLVPEETPEQRTKLVEEIWKTFEKLGVPLDISHYNALLKVYLENEHKFSPTEFLAKLDANGIEPNRVTYQRLISGFCQQGDIAGATKILEFMKEKQIPVSEGVFNALILGHSKADDMESAEGILSMMRQASLEPSNETYTMLLSGYAARGDGEAVNRVLTECKVKDILLSDRDFLDIGYTAAVNGHDQLLEEILKNIRHSMGYNQDAVNVIIRLVTAGKDEAAYKVFLSMRPTARSEGTPNMSGHVLIKQLVKCNRPLDQILAWCERLERDGHTSLGLWLATEASFHQSNTHLTVDLLRELRRREEPVRPHYFWPAMVNAGKTSGYDRMLEIIKLMESEFELTLNTESLKDYFFPYVPSSMSFTEVLATLDNIGVRRGQAVVALVSHLVSKKQVKEAFEIALQNPNLNYRQFVTTRQLTDAIQSTNDVHSIMGLVHILNYPRSAAREEKDEEEESGSDESEFASRFLINIVNYTPTRTYTAAVLKEMLEYGIPISNVCAEMVENKLQGKELTAEISGILAKLSSGEVVPQPIRRLASPSTPTVRTPESLTRMKERMKANNEPVERLIGINRSLFQLYCYEGDIENALKIKQELEEEYKVESGPGVYASLLSAYCEKEDLEGAKSCLEKLKSGSSEIEIDAKKALKLAHLFVIKNQIDEVEQLLKSMKPRDKDDGGFQTRNQAWHLLQTVAETYKDPEKVKKILNLLVEQKYVEINNALLGSVIKAYLLRDDIEGALKEFEECVKLHRATPYKHELSIKFIEKEDATNLQTVVDLSTEVHGEVNSLYDLVMSFIECGKIRQARKILETPGLTSRNNRLQLACERYKKEGKTAYLEGLVEATKDFPLIDRSEIYSNLLDTYCQAGEVEKALGLWTKMQDEDVNISDQFLIKLGKFLKENGREVPFKIPKEVPATGGTTNVKANPVQETRQMSLMGALRQKNIDEALKIKEQRESSGKQLSRTECNLLLDLLVGEGKLKEAASFVMSLKPEQLPRKRTLNYLVTRLAGEGEVDLLYQLDTSLPEEIKKITSLSNRILNAACGAGRAKDLLDKIEKEVDYVSNDDDIDRLASKFPRGGIMAVLESSPEFYDQVVRIADKFHSKGFSGPANCVVMHHLTAGEADKARELYKKYKLGNSSQLMFRSVLKRAKREGRPQLLEDLLLLIKDSPAFVPQARAVVYSNIIQIYNYQKDFDMALKKLEEGVKTAPLDMFHTRCLERLKYGLEANNKPFNYTIPPRKNKQEDSSSSSSSESEPKKSVASN